MSVLIVGNIVKDVYLNLDTRTDHFETDKNHVKWLNLPFNASEHHFLNRTSCLNGAAISLEVCQNFRIPAKISNSDLSFSKQQDNPLLVQTSDYRYIMNTDNQSAFFTSNSRPRTIFVPPLTPPDYIYIDRSAYLPLSSITAISSYLQNHNTTKLVLYLTPQNSNKLSLLAPLANLVFLELPAPHNHLKNPHIVYIHPKYLKYQDIKEPLHLQSADLFTHLSLFSIASATILCNFILGKTVEHSLKMARLNVENSHLNSTLTPEELQNLLPSINSRNQLELISQMLITKPKQILDLDDPSNPLNLTFSTPPNTTREYHNSVITSPNLNELVNGVILSSNTIYHTTNTGQNFVNYLISKRIIPGIKIAPNFIDLDTLLQKYYQMGLRFAQCRIILSADSNSNNLQNDPTKASIISANCHTLATFANKCQLANLVPIISIITRSSNPTKPNPLVINSVQDFSHTMPKLLTSYLLPELQKQAVNPRACILETNISSS